MTYLIIITIPPWHFNMTKYIKMGKNVFVYEHTAIYPTGKTNKMSDRTNKTFYNIRATDLCFNLLYVL